MDSTTIRIKGMTCGGCVASVERVLSALPGVAKVSVSLERGEAAVDYAPGQVSVAELHSAIEDAGYDVAA